MFWYRGRKRRSGSGGELLISTGSYYEGDQSYFSAVCCVRILASRIPCRMSHVRSLAVYRFPVLSVLHSRFLVKIDQAFNRAVDLPLLLVLLH